MVGLPRESLLIRSSGSRPTRRQPALRSDQRLDRSEGVNAQTGPHVQSGVPSPDKATDVSWELASAEGRSPGGTPAQSSDRGGRSDVASGVRSDFPPRSPQSRGARWRPIPTVQSHLRAANHPPATVDPSRTPRLRSIALLGPHGAAPTGAPPTGAAPGRLVVRGAPGACIRTHDLATGAARRSRRLRLAAAGSAPPWLPRAATSRGSGNRGHWRRCGARPGFDGYGPTRWPARRQPGGRQAVAHPQRHPHLRSKRFAVGSFRTQATRP